MGVVEFPGKSRARAEATSRGTALVGNTVASVPPQMTLRKGDPSASNSTTIDTVTTIGFRMTWFARRKNRPDSTGDSGRVIDLRIRSELTRGPRTDSSAGIVVRAAVTSRATVS